MIQLWRRIASAKPKSNHRGNARIPVPRPAPRAGKSMPSPVMKIIAHRGGMGKGQQNTPDGVRLAIRHHADFVELDVIAKADGRFRCAHGWSPGAELASCLVEIGPGMELIAHLKGSYQKGQLMLLAAAIDRQIPLKRVIFASHRNDVLWHLRGLMPESRLARFGLFPAVVALWRKPPWDYCMINQSVLCGSHVLALQRRGCKVFASCVWEFRSRRSLMRLGVDGVFVNLR